MFDFRQVIKSIFPQFIIEALKGMRRKRKQKQRDHLKASNKVVTEKEIADCLLNVGVNEGDVLMLHSSLSQLGYVEGGGQAVINGCLKAVGSNGTLVMPVFPAMGFNYDYLNTCPVFDVRTTSSKMGVITELFRKMKGVKRSIHPTDSVCAFGPQADYLVKDHFNQLTPYNAQSPFYKLCLLKAKIILMGVDLNSLTNFHTLEDAVQNFDYPVYHQTIFETKVIDELGKILVMKTKVHDPVISKQRRCNDFIVPFKEAGILKQFKIGLADCTMIDAHRMHEWMLEQYEKKGITLYSPQGNRN